MGSMLKVAPVSGRTMVFEDRPRVRIAAPCLVPDSKFYRRALARGDLSSWDGTSAGVPPVLATEVEPTPAKPARGGK